MQTEKRKWKANLFAYFKFCILTEYGISKMLQNIFHGPDGIYGI